MRMIAITLLLGFLACEYSCTSLMGQEPKHQIEYSAAQYIVRENGVFEIDFIYPNSGAPNFGIADITRVSSPETTSLLDLEASQVRELNQIRKRILAMRKEAGQTPKNIQTLEENYRGQVFKVFDDTQAENWHWFNRRHVFFSTGLVNFLAHPKNKQALNLEKSQLEKVKASRNEHATWLRKEMNLLFDKALDIQIEKLPLKIKQEIRNRLGLETNPDENLAIVRSPSVFYRFLDKKNEVHYDKSLGFAQTVWRLNLKSELVCTLGSSYETGMSNLTRFYWFYKSNFANEAESKLISEQLEILSSTPLFDDTFFSKNEQGDVPFIVFMERLFQAVRERQEDDSFDRFVFQSYVNNLGIRESLTSGCSFAHDHFSVEDLRQISQASEEVANFLRVESNKVLKRFVMEQLNSLNDSQRKQVLDMLVPGDEEQFTMAPLELVYLGVAMSDSDRSSYASSKNRIVGYRVPDYDLYGTESESKKILVDQRPARFSTPPSDRQ